MCLIITGLFVFFFNFKNPSCGPPIRETYLKVGVIGIPMDWDPAISMGDNVLSDYFALNCLESLFWYSKGSSLPKSLLATSISFEYWPEEMNSQGFVNRGGIKTVNIVLRQGVRFHDGSIWNATVAKWNIDRMFMITGNLTGNGDTKNMLQCWKKAIDYYSFFTPNWNLSWALGQSATYNGFVSPDPELNGRFSVINKTIILDNGDIFSGGGTIRVEYNDWNSHGLLALTFPMISMHTYKNYYNKGIYGWTGINPPHLVGTGPYIFANYSSYGITSEGILMKNLNYWNHSALEFEEKFGVEYIDILSFPSTQLGIIARNTAMVTADIDYGIDSTKQPFDYEEVIMNPNINYFDLGYSDSPITISLNCINETWMSWGAPYNYSSDIENIYGNKPDGLPRALRRAISYAVDYDLFISAILDGRAVRAGGVLGIDSSYYNSSIPLAIYNKTKARNILLNAESDIYTQTNFSYLCSERGLNESSTNADWRYVADNNPLWVLDFYWNENFVDFKTLLEINIRDIGIALKDPLGTTNFISYPMWDVISHYRNGTFPLFSAHAWPLDWNYPNKATEVGLEINYGDPNDGNWRVDPWLPANDPTWNWFPGFNLHFCYDSEIDYWLDRINFSNNTGRLKWLNKMVEKVQTELYPMVYLTQKIIGAVAWYPWEIDFSRGPFYFANINGWLYYACTTLPGYDIFILLGIAVLTLIITTKRKKNFTFHS
ncbi:MAG: ABC transporter substrate-binding protein [Candidatus Thorarchaeota archaeon]